MQNKRPVWRFRFEDNGQIVRVRQREGVWLDFGPWATKEEALVAFMNECFAPAPGYLCYDLCCEPADSAEFVDLRTYFGIGDQDLMVRYAPGCHQ